MHLSFNRFDSFKTIWSVDIGLEIILNIILWFAWHVHVVFDFIKVFIDLTGCVKKVSCNQAEEHGVPDDCNGKVVCKEERNLAYQNKAQNPID